MHTTTARSSRRVACGAMALLAAISLAACSDDEATDDAATSDTTGIVVENPPATLEADGFADPVTVADGATHDSDVAIDRATGRIYVAWAQDLPKAEDQNFTPQDVYLAHSDDAGATFSDPVRVNKNDGEVNAGFNNSVKVAVTGDDRVLVTWPVMNDDMSVMRVAYALSTDGGTTFPEGQWISAADGEETSELYQDIAVSGDKVWIGYLDYRSDPTGIAVVSSDDGGETFGPSTRVEMTSCECCDNALAADSAGTVFFAFRNKDQFSANTQVRDSAVARSYDDGATWSDPVKLGNDNWRFNGCPEAGPEITIDSHDNLQNVYYTGVEGRQGVYFTRSDDGGQTFATPTAVATADFYPPAYMDLATTDADETWIVWDDRRTKDQTVNLARVADGDIEQLPEPFADGNTPSIDTDGTLTAIVWSDADGLRLAASGEPKESR